MNDSLNKTKRGRDSDAYYRSHHEIDTAIGHSLGGAVALRLEKQYKQQTDNPYGIIQFKTFGSLTVSSNLSGINLNRIRWAGDLISALDFNSTTYIQSIHRKPCNIERHSHLHIYKAFIEHGLEHFFELVEKPPCNDREELHKKAGTSKGNKTIIKFICSWEKPKRMDKGQ